MSRQNPDEPLWKRRFETLCQDLEDMKFTIRNKGLDVADERAWDAPELIYVSFCNDVCDSESHALKHYGKDNYDVYRLERKSPKE